MNSSCNCVTCDGFGVSEVGIPCDGCDGTGLAPLTLEAYIDESLPCEHANFAAYAARSTPWDDHVTLYGRCPSCDAWLVCTDDVTGRPFAYRLMTANEINRLGSYEDRCRFTEWLGDYNG